jgi:acyl-CoA synthetase (NDP forming)
VAHPYAYLAAVPRAKVFSEAAKRYGKIACTVWLPEFLEGPGAREAETDSHVAMFRSVDRCFATLASWQVREQWLSAQPRKLGRVAPKEAALTAAKLLDAASNRVLTEREAKEVLAAYGVPVVGEKLVQSANEAAAAATSLGFPVALKVESPDLPHKTEAGVIRLGLKTEADVKAAFDAVMANADKVNPKPKLNGVLVQPMIGAGTEVIVGARIDPQFGPLVVAGLGGILVELLKDAQVELAPVNNSEARAMLGRLKGQAALTGFRGSEPVDLDKLADIIARLSEFAADQQQRIAELDVNPLICSGGRVVAVDALIVRKQWLGQAS